MHHVAPSAGDIGLVLIRHDRDDARWAVEAVEAGYWLSAVTTCREGLGGRDPALPAVTSRA